MFLLHLIKKFLSSRASIDDKRTRCSNFWTEKNSCNSAIASGISLQDSLPSGNRIASNAFQYPKKIQLNATSSIISQKNGQIIFIFRRGTSKILFAVPTPLEGGRIIYSSGFFVQPILIFRYINRRDLWVVSQKSPSSVEYGIKKIILKFHFLERAVVV